MWECTLKKLLTTDTPECRIRPGLKELTLVVPLTRLWTSYLVPFPSTAEAAHRSPLVERPGTARHPSADLPAEEDSASDATGSAERSPRFALPVPVGLAEPLEAGTEEATKDEDMAAEPNYAFAKGYGRFGIGYTRLATALGNFEQGNIQAESTVVAQWLTSGLRVAMSRTGWNLLSPRYMLTRVPSALLSNYYCHGYPFTPKMEDRPYNQYGQLLYSEGRWDQLPSLEVSSQATSRRLGTKWATVRKPPTQVIKLAVLSLLQGGKLLVCSRVFLSHQASPTASALWVVAVGRSSVGVSTHSHRLLVT